MLHEIAINIPGLPANWYDLHYAALRSVHGSIEAKRNFVFTIEPDLRMMVIRSRLFEERLLRFARPLSLPELGAKMRFRLTAHPTWTRTADDRRLQFREGDNNGRIEWLKRREARGGFKVLALDSVITNFRPVIRKGSHVGGGNGFDYTTFNGSLEVTDRENFARALELGIGHGRAFGAGMLAIFGEENGQQAFSGN